MHSILTRREREIFTRLVDNKTAQIIAGELGISEKTVRNHISNVMGKLGAASRIQAVLELIRLNELKL